MSDNSILNLHNIDYQTFNNIKKLLDVMQQLRHPADGCPWDIEQTFDTIAPYTIEEAYEVADAIERNDMDDLKLELGDLLLQVVYHSRIAEEKNHFNFDDVAEAITQKMINRHPHVFDKAQNHQHSSEAWEKQKEQERKNKNIDASVMDDVPLSLPALARAQKIQKRAARVGFDWDDPEPMLDKIIEEINELKVEIANKDKNAMKDEFGDIIFSLVNLGRWLKIDTENALKSTNQKFISRFNYIEEQLKLKNKDIMNTTLAEMEELWVKSKQL